VSLSLPLTKSVSLTAPILPMARLSIFNARFAPFSPHPPALLPSVHLLTSSLSFSPTTPSIMLAHALLRWRSSKHRVGALVLSILGAVVNSALAIQLLSYWRVLKWESESEWEGTAGGWQVNGIKLVWGLLSAYFTTASIVCVVGAAGVIKRKDSFVRLYRDYSVADLCFCGLMTAGLALASFRSTSRTAVCEEFAREPELLRDLAEAGLNPENCEQWLEHVVVGFVGVTAILLVVRLQFILTVSNYYKQLMRERLYDSIELCGSEAALDGVISEDGTPRRIFLLPVHSNGKGKATVNSPTASSSAARDPAVAGAMLVYAPVPLDSLTEEEARDLATGEAWVACPNARVPSHSRRHSHSHNHAHTTSHGRLHRHAHARSRSHSLSQSLQYGTGRISLPIHPGEGLLPSYTELGGDLHKA